MKIDNTLLEEFMMERFKGEKRRFEEGEEGIEYESDEGEYHFKYRCDRAEIGNFNVRVEEFETDTGEAEDCNTVTGKGWTVYWVKRYEKDIDKDLIVSYGVCESCPSVVRFDFKIDVDKEDFSKSGFSFDIT